MSESNPEERPDAGAPVDPTAPFDPTADTPYPSTYEGQTPPPPPIPTPEEYAAPPAADYPPPPSGSPYGQPGDPSGFGTPPSAYGPSTPSGYASPYGTPGGVYGTPPPAYYQPQASQTNTSALILTIISGLGVVSCCAVTIVPLIFGIMGLAKQTTEPEQSAKLSRWGWISFGITVGIVILAVIAFVVATNVRSAY